MMQSVESVHHGASGSSSGKLDYVMENPHDTENSQYVNEEPGCVPIENEPTAPPQPTAAPAQPMTSHPAAPIMAPPSNFVQGPGPSTLSTVPATVQVPVNMVYTKPITGPVGPFLVQRYQNTNNLIIIPPAGVIFKTAGDPVVVTETLATAMTQPVVQHAQMAVESTKQGQRRTLSSMTTTGPEEKRARIVENVQYGPVGPMNSRGHKNNPTIAAVHVQPATDNAKCNRFDPARYQPPPVQENNFQEEEDENVQVPIPSEANVSEPTSQWGAEEQIFVELEPVPEDYEMGCDGKIDHDDIHGNGYQIQDEQAPSLTYGQILDTIEALGDSHKHEKVPVNRKYCITKILFHDEPNRNSADIFFRNSKCTGSYRTSRLYVRK